MVLEGGGVEANEGLVRKEGNLEAGNVLCDEKDGIEKEKDGIEKEKDGKLDAERGILEAEKGNFVL